MSKEFDHLSGEEKLKAENEFLKLKMMLEQGAMFGGAQSLGQSGNELPPDIENQFLKNIMAFEEKFNGERKVIKVFDKIGCPQQFKPANQIAENEIEAAWEQLSAYLQSHDICLSAISPKVTDRELYRFTTEELFEYETDEQHLPGWTTHFTYDEFYPDHEYENTNAAVDDCMGGILSAGPMEWMMHFRKENLRLNQHDGLTEDGFKRQVNLFKAAYDDIAESDIVSDGCQFNQDSCIVTGTYLLKLVHQGNSTTTKGNWKVEFEKDTDLGYWNIFAVDISDINF